MSLKNINWLTLTHLLMLISALTANHFAYAEESEKFDQKLFTAAAFGPDGRLWRVVPSQDKVEVDYSLDYGKTFSKPVRVNPKPQAMNFWDENPPSIAVDKQGKVSVLYFADSKQDYTSFFSQSGDGIHFSKPVKVSTKANSQIHYQTEMWLDKGGKAHFLWHDVRDEKEYKKQGGGDLSIYHVAVDPSKPLKAQKDHRIAKNICSCCRSAVALDVDGLPVVLARFVYPGSIRDHGLFKLNADGKASEPWRVTYDDWKIDGCPTHGPALSISDDGHYHMAWFSQGTKQSGLFYAWSGNQGKTFSKPLSIGNADKLPGRADVMALGNKVALVWKEFDGKITTINTIVSEDSGLHWSSLKQLATSSAASNHPALINDGKHIFMTWNNADKGFQLIQVD
ncbi:MAG: exo-alpha-sialidase [Methyloglobulus sp.]|nr:exo-alpha-sialidase [Methyloglobulus sp.]